MLFPSKLTFLQIIVLILGIQTAAAPIVEPLLPVLSLPIQTQRTSSASAPISTPSQSTTINSWAPTRLFKYFYQYIRPRNIVSSASTPALSRNADMSTNILAPASLLNSINQMIESNGGLLTNRFNSSHQSIYPRDLVPGGAKVSIPKGMGKNEVDLWWELSHSSLPVQPGDEFVLWTGKAAEGQLTNFWYKLENDNPGLQAWTSADFVNAWQYAFDDYYRAQSEAFPHGSSTPWVGDAILSMKIAEVVSKYASKVHVLYSYPDNNNIPSGTYLTSAEMPIVTGPGSRVTEIYRWEANSFWKDNFKPKRIWQNGDAQMGSIITDLAKNPKGKGKEPENSEPPESQEQFPDSPDFDFDNIPTIDQARQTMDRALSDILGKAQNSAISDIDVKKTFSASEDLYLSALKTIKDKGHITSEAENAVAEYSPLNIGNSLVADPVADRFKWNLRNNGNVDAAMDNAMLLNGKPDGKGNLVDNMGAKVPIKNFEASIPDPSLVAKAQLASFGIAKHLMDPEQFAAQTPAMQQIMNLAAHPSMFSKLAVFGEQTTSSAVIDPEADQALALSRLVKKGVTNTDWWKDTPEEMEEIVRHTWLAVTQGAEKYNHLISQPNLPLKADLIKQAKAFEDTFSNIATNLPAEVPIPRIPIEELSNMPVKTVLSKSLTIGGAIGGSVGIAAGIALPILGGLWWGGILTRNHKRFNAKKQDLVECEGKCKPVSEHKYEKKATKPKPVGAKMSTVTTVKSTTLIKSVVKSQHTTSTTSKPSTASTSKVSSKSTLATSKSMPTSSRSIVKSTSALSHSKSPHATSPTLTSSKSLTRSTLAMSPTNRTSAQPTSPTRTSSGLSTTSKAHSSSSILPTSSTYHSSSFSLAISASKGPGRTRVPKPTFVVIPAAVSTIWQTRNRQSVASNVTSTNGTVTGSMVVKTSLILSTSSASIPKTNTIPVWQPPTRQPVLSDTTLASNTTPETMPASLTVSALSTNSASDVPTEGTVPMWQPPNRQPFRNTTGSDTNTQSNHNGSTPVPVPATIPVWQAPNRQPFNSSINNITVTGTRNQTSNSAYTNTTNLSLPAPIWPILNNSSLGKWTFSGSINRTALKVSANETFPQWQPPISSPINVAINNGTYAQPKNQTSIPIYSNTTVPALQSSKWQPLNITSRNSTIPTMQNKTSILMPTKPVANETNSLFNFLPKSNNTSLTPTTGNWTLAGSRDWAWKRGKQRVSVPVLLYA